MIALAKYDTRPRGVFIRTEKGVAKAEGLELRDSLHWGAAPDGPAFIQENGLRFGLDFRWYYRGEGYRYRFSEEGHLDLCDVISDHGAAKMTSLDGAARIIGLPGKDGVDGSQVEGLFHAGQLEALRRYCLSDVAQTAFLFLRFRLVAGDLDRDGYRHAAAGLLGACESDGRFGKLLDGVNRQRLLLGD